MIRQVCTELGIFALEVAVSIWNEEPSDQTTDAGEGCTDQEYALHALLFAVKGVLDRSEDLSSDRSSSLTDSSCEAEEMSTERCRERLCRAQECCYA